MKHTLFLMVYLLSTALMQVAYLTAECPCKQPPKPPELFCYAKHLFGCGCGGGGVGTNNDEIPPDQD